MLAGSTLKAIRTLDGAKIHVLEPPEGKAEVLDSAVVEGLKQAGLIASNMKFPAASYLLTEHGARAAASLARSSQRRRSVGTERSP